MGRNKDYDNTNSGAIFRNYDKENMKDERDTSKWANAQGTLDVYGMKFYISSWTNVIKNGENKGDKFQSLKIQPAEEKEGEKLKQAIKQILDGGNPAANNNLKDKKKGVNSLDSDFDDMDDDLPF